MVAKYELTLSLKKNNDPTDIFADPADPTTRRVESGVEITTKVIQADNLLQLKTALADFRQNLRES